MAISTNSIIHYTDSFQKLKLILLEGFAIKYCAEKLIVDDEISSAAAHPMISFCDIPLTQAFRHFSAYGRYGIGLSKEWANKLGINPVLYLDKNSSATKALGHLLKERREKTTTLTPVLRNKILRIKCFTKNYTGLLKRKDVEIPNYRFYDEREWRYVPEGKYLNGAKFSIHLKDYLKDKEKYNNSLSDIRIEFNHNDITYIIVDKVAEIPQLIKAIRNSYSNKCTADDLDIFFSKICSTNQIENDY